MDFVLNTFLNSNFSKLDLECGPFTCNGGLDIVLLLRSWMLIPPPQYSALIQAAHQWAQFKIQMNVSMVWCMRYCPGCSMGLFFLLSFFLSEENFKSRYTYRIWLPTFIHVAYMHSTFCPHATRGFLWKWLCVGAVICTSLCARSLLSFSKATNWIIKGALYTPISRRWQGEEGLLDCIRGKRRKTGWYTSNHSERLMCARWGRHALQPAGGNEAGF